ncbi:MAG: hypothetical protein JST65_14215 [Acidobacteria bacterium]|nr:hypothetical protein [Acidobacteriota bacterium]
MACLFAFGSAAIAQNQYVVFHSGAGNSSTNVYPYLIGAVIQPLQPLVVSGGVFKIVPVPDGTKYYAIADGGTAVTSIQGSFTAPVAVATAFSGAPKAAVVSPDGTKLFVAAGKVYVISTNSDQVLNPTGITVPGEAIDIAVSWDSTRLYVLSRGAVASDTNFTTVTAFDIVNNYSKQAEISFGGNPQQPPTGLLIGPNGMLYLSAYSRVHEIKPETLTLTASGSISVSGYPGKGTVTADGKYIVFPNLTPNFGGNSVIQLSLDTKSFKYGAASSEIFTKFWNATLDTSPTKLYGYSTSGRLYEITLGDQVITDYAATINNVFGTGTAAPVYPNVAFSNEVPPRTIWITRNITNLDGSSSRELAQMALPGGTAILQRVLPFTQQMELSFVTPGVTSGGSRIRGTNLEQTVSGGGRAALPLIARMIDGAGRGIYRGQITYTSENPAVVFSQAQVVTGSDGYAQTFVTVPSTPGVYKVMAQGGQDVTPVEYTLTVPGIPGGGGGGSQGGIFIFSGNGQLQRENFPLSEPMVVQVLDANGFPLSGQKVVWTQVSGTGLLAGASIENNTDQEGKAYLQFTTGLVNVPFAAAQDVIEAATAVGKVTFYSTTLAIRQPNGALAGDAQIEYVYPNLNDLNNRNFTLEAGQTLPNAIGVRVADHTGQPIANVGMQVTTTPPSVYEGTAGPPAGFTASCATIKLTDPQGNTSCDLKAGNKPGTSTLYVLVGSYRSMSTLNLTITVGKASQLKILAGNGQKAKAQTQLPIPLQVQVTDLGGNPIQGTAVTWSRVGTANFGTFGAERTATNTAGIAQNSFRTGTVPGKYQVRAQIDNPSGVAGASPIFVTFDVEIETTLGGLVQITGNGQSVGTNAPFPQPLVVQVNDLNGQPLSGIRVDFVAIGAGTVSPAFATTDAAGRASVTARAGGSAGSLTITATVNTLSTQFGLTVTPPSPTILGTNIVNTASQQVGLTPCGLATISGTNLLPGITGIVQPQGFGQLPITLGPVTGITIGGITAPIVRLVNAGGKEMVDIQTPCEVQPGFATVVVNVNGQSPATINSVPVYQYQPGIFEYDESDGRRYAVAVKADGSFVSPSNPADRGTTIRLLATGLGQTSPSMGTNRAGIPNQLVVANLIGGVNDAGVRVVRAEAVQGQIGNYLVEIEIPATTAAGPYQSVALAIPTGAGEVTFSNGAYIPIR